MGASKVSWFFYLLGFFLIFRGVFSKPSSIVSKDLQSKGVSKYVENYRMNIQSVNEFTGFRSVFQWRVGKSKNNTGIHNAMQFAVNDLINENKQLFGQIGIYSSGSQIGIHLSFDSVTSYTPGSSFKCSTNFPFYTGSYSCFNSNYRLISNAIYYLDVEIRDNTIRGYISQPQTNLTNISNSSLPRTLIGEMKHVNKLGNLRPHSYWIAKSMTPCYLSSDITTFNYIPELYRYDKRQKAVYTDSTLFVGLMCGPLNTLALTGIDWSTVVFISRPSPVINATSSMDS